MGRKFLISFVIMFVMTVAFGYIVHDLLLGADYAQVAQLFRDPADTSHMPFLFIGQAFYAAGFTWIYLKGKEDKPFLMQGVRYGLAIAALAAVSMYLIYYAVQPLPGMLVVKQIIFESVGVVLMGIVIAWLNK